MKRFDERGLNPNEYPVAIYSIDQMSWVSDTEHDPKTEKIRLNGTVKQICIRISSVIADPDVKITITDGLGNKAFEKTFDDGQDLLLFPSDFLPYAGEFVLTGEVTITVDPTANPGGTSQVLTVDLDLFII